MLYDVLKKGSRFGLNPILTLFVLIIISGFISAEIFLVFVAPVVGQETVWETFAKGKLTENTLELFAEFSKPQSDKLCNTDGFCDFAETSEQCPMDCPQQIPFSFCGDRICNNFETSLTCRADCSTLISCGDGTCSSNESHQSCVVDCFEQSVQSFCGNGFCSGDETCSTCSQDCNVCPQVCTANSGVCQPSCFANLQHFPNGDIECNASSICCVQAPIQCGVADQLCPVGCSHLQDIDCTYCGNSIIETPNDVMVTELCDSNSLAGKTCQSFGYIRGTISCSANCQSFNMFNCSNQPMCGNGIVETGEECDETNFNGQTCQDFGFNSGSLQCQAPQTATECNIDTRGCQTSTTGRVLTYWGPNLDVPSEIEWNNDYLPAFRDLNSYGFTQVGIHTPYQTLNPIITSTNEVYWNQYTTRVTDLRTHGFDLALHFSPGRILMDPNELDGSIQSNGQDAKYYDSTGFSASECNGFATPCETSGLPYDPAYSGVVWQKELNLLRAGVQRASVGANDLVLFDQEIWGGNLGWCEWGILWQNANNPITSGFILNGSYPHLLENSTGRYIGPAGQPAYVQEKQFINYWKARSIDLTNVVKDEAPNTKVLFYGENPPYNPTIPQACSRYPLCPDGTLDQNECPVDEATYAPIGSGDAASPIFYLLPDISVIQTQLGKGNYAGSFVWVNFYQPVYGQTGPWNLNWDPKVTQKIGKLLRDQGVAGVIIYTAPFALGIPIGDYKAHAKALADGFLRNQDPGELVEICGDGWDNDGDGEFDEGCGA